MDKILKNADKGLGCLVTIIGIITVVFIVFYFFYMIGEVIDFLAFYFHLVLIVVVIAGLWYMYYVHPKFTLEENNTIIGGKRVTLTLAGFLFIWFLYSFPQFFRMYNDGNYCANVEYETSQGFSDVNIPVTVENGEVVKLFWSNGGYMDQSHFSGAIVDGDGSTYFTDDRDRTFYIELISRGGSCTK